MMRLNSTKPAHTKTTLFWFSSVFRRGSNMDHLQYRHALAAQLEASELAFPVAEYEARLTRVRNAMRERGLDRSEERRVGKEWRCGGWTEDGRKKEGWGAGWEM